jgi:hypothetical protein
MIENPCPPAGTRPLPSLLQDERGGGDDGGRRSYLAIALDAVTQIMRWRMLHTTKDEIGVMFYGAVGLGGSGKAGGGMGESRLPGARV